MTCYQPIEIGQLWTVKGLEKEFRCLILKTENIGGEEVVHIAILNQNLDVRTIHMPFSRDRIQKSIASKLADNFPLVDFEEGYNIWRKEFDFERAGIYDINISDIID